MGNQGVRGAKNQTWLKGQADVICGFELSQKLGVGIKRPRASEVSNCIVAVWVLEIASAGCDESAVLSGKQGLSAAGFLGAARLFDGSAARRPSSLKKMK